MKIWGRVLLRGGLTALLVLPPALGAQAGAPRGGAGSGGPANAAAAAGLTVTGLVAHPAERELVYARTSGSGVSRWETAASHWKPLLGWLPADRHGLLAVESMALDPGDARKLYVVAGGDVGEPARPEGGAADATPAGGAGAGGKAGASMHVQPGALLRSTDQGLHFETVAVPFRVGGGEAAAFAGERLAVDPNQTQVLWMGSRVDGLWRSADAGLSWHRARTFGALPLNRVGLTFVALDARSGVKGRETPVIVVGVCDPVLGLMRSDDAGRSWRAVPGGPASGPEAGGGTFPNHGVFGADGVLYLSYGDAVQLGGMRAGSVWAYTPRTGAWREITPEGAAGTKPSRAAGVPAGQGAPAAGRNLFGFGALAVDPAHPGTVLVATAGRPGGEQVLRSTDAGTHWAQVGDGLVGEHAVGALGVDAAARVWAGGWTAVDQGEGSAVHWVRAGWE